jgi:hypothetical protein
MHKLTKTLGAGVATLACVAATAGTATASSTIIKVGKHGELSASHKIAWVRAKVVCTEDTTSAILSARLTQVTVGGFQSARGTVASLGAFECAGNEEVVYVPVRRPTGGFKWEKGTARVSRLVFATEDPTGDFWDIIKGRTIHLR